MSEAGALLSRAKIVQTSGRGRALVAACVAHILHDGLLDLLYVLLPIWKVEFGLGYAAVGMLRATYSASMAIAQVPVDHMTSRMDARKALVGGTVVSAAGFLLMGASHGIAILYVALVIAGLGSSTQHPRASAIIIQAYGLRSRGALGIYNFAGDAGKAILPGLVALLLIAMTWHAIAYLLAAFAVACSLVLFALLPWTAAAPEEDPLSARSEGRAGFWLLFVIGALDTATRMGFLLFLPFVLADRHASQATIGFGLALVFSGGAFGKFAFGWLGEQLGMARTVVATECATAVMIGAVPLLPLYLLLPALLALGIALNGTSSVLYGTVPDVTKDGNVGRAFALFYTGVIGAGALAPIIYGTIADHLGRNAALIASAGTALAAIPLAISLQTRLGNRQPAI